MLVLESDRHTPGRSSFSPVELDADAGLDLPADPTGEELCCFLLTWSLKHLEHKPSNESFP